MHEETIVSRGPAAVRVSDGLAAGHLLDAAELVFEYMAATQAEAGRPEAASVSELPAVLRRECEDLAACYAPPDCPMASLTGWTGGTIASALDQPVVG
jgi:hypothetical protein